MKFAGASWMVRRSLNATECSAVNSNEWRLMGRTLRVASVRWVFISCWSGGCSNSPLLERTNHMNIKDAMASFVVVAAVGVTACGGGEGTSSATTTVAETTTTIEATTTTVEATTTTVRTSTTFPYEIVPMDVTEYDPNGEYMVPIPDDGTYPIDGRNPLHPDALTLREISELPAGVAICPQGSPCLGGAAVCIRGGEDVDGLVFQSFGQPDRLPSTVVLQTLAMNTDVPVNYLAFSVQLETGMPYHLDAVSYGVVNSPEGNWPTFSYVTNGRCNTPAEVPTTRVAATGSSPTSFPYQIIPLPGVEYPAGGWHLDPIPDDGSFPIDGRNPLHQDAMTLREFMELPVDSPVCVRDGRDGSDDFSGTRKRAWVNRGLGYTGDEFLGYLVISVSGSSDGELSAVSAGVINSPDGTWPPTLSYVTNGRC